MERLGVILIAVFVLLAAGTANGAVTVFSAKDTGSGESTPLASWPNSDAAAASFLAGLSGVGTESFEGFADDQPMNGETLTFGAVTATFSGAMSVNDVPSGSTNGKGRYATDGTKYLEGTTDEFTVAFNTAVAAFGFFGIDIGDFKGEAQITTVNGGSHTYDILGDSAGGSICFWGIIDTDNLFTSITISNSEVGTDKFGFDEMTVGSLEQVVVPAPGALLLASLGVGLVGWMRRRRAL